MDLSLSIHDNYGIHLVFLSPAYEKMSELMRGIRASDLHW